MPQETARQTYNPEVAIVSSFQGLSSNTYLANAEVTEADRSNNIVIAGDGVIRRRKGSKVDNYFYDSPLSSKANAFKFSYDNLTVLAIKVNADLFLILRNADGSTAQAITKTGVFNQAQDEASFDVVTEDDVCWLFVATENTPLIVVPIIKRVVSGIVNTGVNSFTGVISRYPSSNNITAANTFVTSDAGLSFPVTSLSQSGFNLTFGKTSHGLTSSDRIRIYVAYVCRCTTASYYPGSYLYNSSVRANSIPLDVNVQTNSLILDSPILDEQVPSISAGTIKAYSSPSIPYTVSALPATASEYALTDGAYSPGASSLVNSPEFISFGALQASTDTTVVHQYRLREIPTTRSINRSVGEVSVSVDKVTAAPTYYQENGTVTTTNSLRYFQTSAPLSSVVECVVWSGFSPTTLVDLDKFAVIDIGDNFTIPLYGYAGVADLFTSKYPNIVKAVGNRLVLAGVNNRVGVGNADWKYRGISWNNFQVSSIAFSENSAYTIRLLQDASKVTAVESVNGVLIVGTDVGTFRVSGSNAVTPPNASTSLVSKISDGRVETSKCLLVWEGRVFVVNEYGLYKLEYTQDSEDIVTTSLSTQVQDMFGRYRSVALAYSQFYRSFLVEFAETDRLLVYNLASSTYSTFLPSLVGKPLIENTLDGYIMRIVQDNNLESLFVCSFSEDDTDFANILSLTNTSTLMMRPRSVTLDDETINLDDLNTPAELVQVSGISKAQGKNSVKGTGTIYDVEIEDTGGGGGGGGGVITVPWTPADITTAAWYDADDASTITLGTGVTEWRDKSGNNRHLVETNTSWQPGLVTAALNGKNVIDFFSDKGLATAGSFVSKYVITVIKSVNNSTWTSYHCPGGRGNNFRDGSLLEAYGTGFHSNMLPVAAWQNGVSVTVSANCFSNIGNYFIMGSALLDAPADRFFVGNWAAGIGGTAIQSEVIVFDNVPTLEDRQKIEGYLAHKWGLAGSLASDHPYKAAPPTITTGEPEPEVPDPYLVPYPVISVYTSKAFVEEKMTNATRLRSLLLLLQGAGTAQVRVQGAGAGESVEYTMGTDGVRTLRGQVSDSISTDLDWCKVRTQGVGAFWYVVMQIGIGLVVVGYQLDTSRQGTSKLERA